MATNNLAPTGFGYLRNSLIGAATFAADQRTIANGYGTAIMMGDPCIIFNDGTVRAVVAGVGTNLGLLGIFAGVLPYYDTTLQATSHGLNGAYLPVAAPPTGANIPCLVITDPFATFMVQTNGVAGFLQSWVGMNCSWVAGSTGNVGQGSNAAGRSAALIDTVTTPVGTGNTLPFRIVGPVGVTGGPQDPANANPWIEVRMNQPAALAPLGV
jgi:hypothetical protein